LQETVYKTHITHLDLSTTPLTNGCHNDDMTQLGPTLFSVAVLVRPDQLCLFCTSSLAIVPHAIIKWIQIWGIWRHSWDGIISGVFFCNDSMVARVW